jgi:hypothetical protein
MHQRTQHRRWILSLVIVIIALMVATPVLADYLGPNRTVTETHNVCRVSLEECQYIEAKSDWGYKTVESWSCSLESKPWQAYSSDRRPCSDVNHTNGYQYWERNETTRTETNTYPPATINGTLQSCTLQNGWCTTPPQLSLSGVEPVTGYNIFAIEGTLNGQSFACTNASCNVPLIQGDNDLSYWALSSFGDSSIMGALTAKVDTQLPNITSSLSGTAGLNGWYLSSVNLTSFASDATSGLASFTCTRDGVALVSCNLITFNTDGPHTLVLTARDNAGHIRTLTQNTSIDTKNPVLSASLSGTVGSNSWYTTAALNASASDPSPGSGLSALQYNFDGSGWTAFPASGTLNLSEGKHNVDLRAVDKAGRTVSSTKSYWLDTGAPSANLDSSGTFGLNNWYITSPTLTASANDNISGLDILEYSLDGSGWTAYTTPISLSDGVHSISIWAQDQAGLVIQVDRTYQVDTQPPQIAGSLSGIPGMNGWYVSEVMISASASDPLPGSDIDTFAYILNGGTEIAYTDSLIFSDGQHALQLVARDRAGLSYSVDQTFNIDTIQPSVTIDTTLPNWVNGTITLNGTADDSRSGLASVELSLDNGQTWQAMTGTNAWSYTWNTADGSNGMREVRVRAIDQAGLSTERTVNVAVDNRTPEINLPASWLQWDTVTLNIMDEHSGLSEARVEISDPQGRWPTRVIQLDPGQFPLSFKWDRRFADDTIAEAGTYEVKVYASDQLGNVTEKAAEILVLLEILPPGPTSTQAYAPTIPANTATPALSPTATRTSLPTTPANVVPPTSTPRATQSVIVRVFGTIAPSAQTSATPTTVSTPRATPTQSNAVDWLQSVFVPDTNEQSTTEILSPQESETIPVSTNSSVLWGTAATAAIAAATAYIQEERRKREEEIARQKALEKKEEERRERMKEQKIAKMDAKRAQEAAWEQARLEESRDSSPIHADIKIARMEHEEGISLSLKNSPPATKPAPSKPSSQDKRAERKDELVQGQINALSAEPQADWKADYDSYMAQKAREEAAKKEQEVPASQSQPKKKSWWDKTIDWVDDHQKEIALGVGVVAGVAAVVLTGGLAAPAVIAVVAGAALAAGVGVGAMTVGLNAHYDRPWNENLLRNVAIAGGTALVVAGAGLALKAVATGVSSYCALHPSTCARVEPVFNALDKVEETWLEGKLAFQTWRGDQVGAAETAFELHSEHADGGMPGNVVAKELGDQLTHLGKNAAPVIQKYGQDVIPLLVKYGDEGLELIQKFGTDGIDLLRKHGNDATDLVVLDDDVLDYVMQQGPDAVEALSRWSKADLLAHGPELALRAKKDAEVLASIKKLSSSGPIDPKHLTKEQKALIEAIAANSTQYADNGQVVLGKWVDNSSGFVQTAQDTGSVHYNPHPDMWTMLGRLGDAKQEEVAWLINKQVVQKGIDKGLPFEYTLNGIPTDKILNEGRAVEAIFAGATDEEIMRILRSDYVPVRMKELKELQKAEYKITFDDVNNSFILVPQ